MSTQKININIQNYYLKNNQIRTKLLLFIDNEIQSKIKQNSLNLKFNYDIEAQFKISFEETFTQKQTDTYSFSPLNIHKTKNNINSDKSFSTVDNSSVTKKNNRSIELSNKIFSFHEQSYSIKNRSKQTSTFLIVSRQKNAAEYLKTLCNNLKICKKEKKIIKQFRSVDIKSKLLELSKDKKSTKKANGIKLQKSQKDTQYTYSLFRKS